MAGLQERAQPGRHGPARAVPRATTKSGARGSVALPLSRKAGGFGYDPAVHDLLRPVFRFLFERYWRVAADGVEHVPDRGAALVVANHSGAVPFDASMIGCAIEFRTAQPRMVRFLFDNFVTGMPLAGALFPKVGAVPASYENAAALLERGELVGVFPEGIAGVAKGFARRYRLEPFRTGFVRLSLAHRVPIVPVAVVGAEETYPVIGKWQRLGPLRQALNVPYVPVTPFFPLLGALGAIPLPSRWHIRFGRPLTFNRDLGQVEVSKRTATLLAQTVRRQIQSMIHQLLAERHSLF